MFEKLQKLREKFFFTTEDVAKLFQIKLESARVLCSRYRNKNIFLRIKKNFYVLEQNWLNFSREDFLKLANFLQVPSYISLITALQEYGITTQVQRDYYESISLKRSVKFSTRGVIFNFYKFKKEYYFGFEKKGEIFIATKEKAFVDAVYLYSFGKYKLDFSSLYIGELDKAKILSISSRFPLKTQNVLRKLCKI